MSQRFPPPIMASDTSSSTASSSPSPSPSASEGPAPSRGSSPSSNLYLVTFLATLFLLLFVSCAIVLRSYILRQRYNRRINDAIAAGLFLAPRAQGSKRRRFGLRPAFIDTWIAAGGAKWDRMIPLSAQRIMVKRRLRDGYVPRLPLPPGASFDPSSPDPATIFPTLDAASRAALPPHPNPTHSAHPITQNQNNTTLRSRVAGFFSLDQHRRMPSGSDDSEHDGDAIPLVAAAAPANTSTTNLSPVGAPAGYKIRVEMLQVAVLIAMPSPSRSHRKNARLDRHGHGVEEDCASSSDDEGDDDDEETTRRPLPELLVGVARVRYPATEAIKGLQPGPLRTSGSLTPTTAAAVAVAAAQPDAAEEEELGEEEDEVLGGEDPESPLPLDAQRPPVSSD